MFMLGINHNEMAMHMHISYMGYVSFKFCNTTCA